MKDAKCTSQDDTAFVEEKEFGSWHEFCNYVLEELIRKPGWIYRGQADYEWQAESTLSRLRKRHPTKRIRVQGDTHTIPSLWAEFPLELFCHCSGIEDEEPTGELLDFTRSAFVALFFAFEPAYVMKDIRDPSSGQDYRAEQEPEFRAMYALAGHLLMDRLVFPAYSPEHDRLVRQQGVLVNLRDHETLEEVAQAYLDRKRKVHLGNRPNHAVSPEERDEILKPILRKFKIPNKERLDCLAALDQMGINRMTLFPGFDGVCAYVNSLPATWNNSLQYLVRCKESAKLDLPLDDAASRVGPAASDAYASESE